jgi:glycosyltransferase involved in cell wall biosynthesis
LLAFVLTPQFSVIIAAFNAERTIAAAVQAALSQTRSDLEVIVVDDGSKDETVRVVEQIGDGRVRVLTQDNSGPAVARNRGIAASRGKYVAFLDSDDLWLPRYLELAGAALDQAANPGFAYTDAYAFDAASGKVRRQSAMERMRPPVPPPSSEAEFLLELLRRNFVYCSTTVPRSVLDHLGGYDEGLVMCEDYELWLRILTAGYRSVWVPGRNALYRLHTGQRHREELQPFIDALGMYAKVSRSSALTDAHREVIAGRRRTLERQLRIVQGDDRIGSTLLHLRHRAGRVRQRMGLADRWCDDPPAEVAAAFPDLGAM